MALAWGVTVYRYWIYTGLFSPIGIDFSLYYGAAQAFVAGDRAAIVDLARLKPYLYQFVSYMKPAEGPPFVGPTPYLPIVLLVAPLTALPPTVAQVCWAAASLGICASVAVDLARRFPGSPWLRAALFLGYLPLGHGIFVGQPTPLLLLAFYQSFRALETGRRLTAGLWLGALLLKPQYALFLLLVLVCKRQWLTLVGVALTGVGLAVLSLAVIGPEGVPGFVDMMRYASGFREVDPIVNAREMITWRGFLLSALPESVTEQQGVALTLALSLLTAAPLIYIWRGEWAPRLPRFATQMLATMCVTLLAGFHGHLHGAVLLLVPGVAVAAYGNGPRFVQLAMRVLLFVPLFYFAKTTSMHTVGLFFVLVMAASLVHIVNAELSLHPSHRSSRRTLPSYAPLPLASGV
jgi:hypothetical protein